MTKPDANLDWNDLRFFLAAARAKTLAGAARALGVEHSTISRRLTALEGAMGGALFTRRPDGLTLTPAGEKILPVVEGIERAVSGAQELAQRQQTIVRLATPSGFNRILAPHVAAFGARHPGTTLEVLGGSGIVDLARGEADVAIRIGTSDDPDLLTKRIGDMPWSLYAAPAYLSRRGAPSDPRDLAGHEVLGFESRLADVAGARWLDAHGAGATVVMRCREMADLIAACVAGTGLAVVPCFIAAVEPSLKRLSDEVLGKSTLSIVYRKEVRSAEPIRAVVDFVVDILSARREEGLT